MTWKKARYFRCILGHSLFLSLAIRLLWGDDQNTPAGIAFLIAVVVAIPDYLAIHRGSRTWDFVFALLSAGAAIVGIILMAAGDLAGN
jgi:hypothetical protein